MAGVPRGIRRFLWKGCSYLSCLKRKTEFLDFIRFIHISISCRGRLTACWLGAVWAVTSTYGSVRRAVDRNGLGGIPLRGMRSLIVHCWRKPMSRGPGDSFWLKLGVGLYQLKNIRFLGRQKTWSPSASLIEKAPYYRCPLLKTQGKVYIYIFY